MFIVHLIKSIPYKILSGFRISLFSLIIDSVFNFNKVVIQRFVKFRNSSLGNYSYVGHSSNINNTTIGKFCSISANVNIGLPSHSISFVSTSPIFCNINNALMKRWVGIDTYNPAPKRTIIENDVWIGINSTILGGVRIGNGVIIAAHSLVTKDIPDYAIVGGVPAKIIRYRFSDEIIKNLLQSQWWNEPATFLKRKDVLALFSNKLTEQKALDLISKVLNESAQQEA